MPPRFAYWTIILDEVPTSFRTKERDEILPLFNQLKAKNPTALLKWFSGGKLWDSPEQAREERERVKVRAFREERAKEAKAQQEGAADPLAEFRTQHGRPADGSDDPSRSAAQPPMPAHDRAPRRGKDWRPGGEHRDPRDKYKLPPGESRKRWKERNLGPRAPSGGGRPQGDRPWSDKPRGPEPGGDRPWSDRPRGPKPGGDRPWSDRPKGDRPFGDRKPYGDRKPFGSRPPGDRPKGDRPFGDRKPYGDRKPFGSRPPGDRPKGDRPFGDRKPYGDRKPFGSRPPGDRPKGDRPFGDRKPYSDRKPFGAKPFGSKPAGRPPGGFKPGGRPPGGFKPGGRPPGGRPPKGRSPRGPRGGK